MHSRLQIITFYSTFKRKTFTKEDLVLMVLMRGDLSITDHDLNVGVWVTDNLTMKIRFGVFSIPRQKKSLTTECQICTTSYFYTKLQNS